MLAALAGVVHERQGAARPEQNQREHYQYGDLHIDLPDSGPRHGARLIVRQMNRK